MTTTSPLNDSIRDSAHLDDLLSAPTAGVLDLFRRLEGDILILGVGGKMGPSLAQMARRAADASGVSRRIIGVSRFSSDGLENQLQKQGIETIPCDLLNAEELAQLPEVRNVVFMAGMKFGSTGRESLTWAMNSYLPALVCQQFRQSRIVAFGTGNVYPISHVTGGGSVETDAPKPVGEYAMSCLGRERIFEHFSRTNSIPLAILRLNYAIAIRYGVLVDIAHQVWEGKPILLGMGMVNVIWQADANAMALQAFDHVTSPPFIVNLAGPELVSVRRVAEQFGALMDKTPIFHGEESPSALISNGQHGHRLFGYPSVGVEQMVRWISDWVMRGGESLGKPTHFETRDGKF